jgi:hypothetical protein
MERNSIDGRAVNFRFGSGQAFEDAKGEPLSGFLDRAVLDHCVDIAQRSMGMLLRMLDPHGQPTEPLLCDRDEIY